MNSWFKVKVKYTKQQENGTFKRVSEPYILSAMTFTDAEARIYEELGEIIRGEFTVLSIERFDVHDLFHYEDLDVWYETVIKFRSESDGDEKAKQVRQKFLVSAPSVAEATARTHESLSTMLVDFEVTSTKVTPIVDIFPYREELDKEISRKPLEEAELSAEPQTDRKVYSDEGEE